MKKSFTIRELPKVERPKEKMEKIDYKAIISKYPWALKEKQKIILSPDSNGFLCGLLMSNFLNWEIVGFYDGKILILKNGLTAKECIFLDIDIYRKEIRSIGHHMVMFDKNSLPVNWDNYANCLQANNLRNFDKLHDWQRKYPFGTVHLLFGILNSQKITVSLASSSSGTLYPNPEIALLFTDGIWNNLFGYTENCINWIKYLDFSNPNNLLYPIFCDNSKIYSFMLAIDWFLRIRDVFNAKQTYKNGEVTLREMKRTGDKLRISDTKGEPINLEKTQLNKYKIDDTEKTRVTGFIEELAKLTGWNYIDDKWNWDNFNLYRFTKRDFKKDKLSICNKNFEDLMSKNPSNWAMTGRGNLEYTLEGPDKLP